jgi:histidinol-phosphate phosphatase family protein
MSPEADSSAAFRPAPGRRPAVFLDRDGTITEDRGYARTAAEIVLLPGAGAAVRTLNRAGVAAVLVTNQSGVGRGFFTLEDLAAQHAELERLLAAHGAALAGIYFCPHHPAAGCPCRKPGPALVTRAAAELGLDLRRSFVVGDRAEDLALARWGLAGGLLVGTGRGPETIAELGSALAPDRVFPDLGAAVAHVLQALARAPRAG